MYLSFIVKSFIVTCFAVGGYTIACKISMRYLTKFMVDYMESLKEDGII